MENEILNDLILTQFKLKALLDDYCTVVSKIENVHVDDVKKRINTNAEAFLLKAKSRGK